MADTVLAGGLVDTGDSLVFTPLNDPVKHVVFSSSRTALRSTMSAAGGSSATGA